MEDWVCTKADRKIQNGVEWHEEDKIRIPDWCHCLIDELSQNTSGTPTKVGDTDHEQFSLLNNDGLDMHVISEEMVCVNCGYTSTPEMIDWHKKGYANMTNVQDECKYDQCPR